MFGTSIKVPLIKYTPFETPTAYPVAVALVEIRVKIVSPLFRVVFPYVTFSSSVNISPSINSTPSPSLAPSLYLTKSVICSTPSSGGKRYPLIVPTTPDVCPLTFVPLPVLAFFNASR